MEYNLMGMKAFPGSIAPVQHVRKISRVAQSATLPGLPGNFRLRNLKDPRMSCFQERIGALNEQLVLTLECPGYVPTPERGNEKPAQFKNLRIEFQDSDSWMNVTGR